MGSNGTALGVIGIILAAGAIGFAFFGWNGQNNLQSDFNNLTQTIVVGLWDALDDNLDFAPHNFQSNWLYEFGDNKLNNTDYISISNTNTRITLLKPGWYRIYLSVMLSSIGPSDVYWTRLLKDGDVEFYFDRHETGTPADSSYHFFGSSGFVYSNGTNYIEVNGYTFSDFFYISSSDDFNQFMIEYIDT